MPFPSKASKSATATVTNTSVGASVPSNGAEALTQQIDCDKVFEQLSSMLSGYCTETMQLPHDAELLTGELAPLLTGLKTMAQALGIDYNPAATSTYTYIVTEKGSSYLGGLSIVKDGDNCALAWGDKTYPIDGNTTMSDPTAWRLITSGDKPENFQASFYFGAASIKMPVGLRVEDRGKLHKDWVTLVKFSQLAPYLKPLGSPTNKFQDLEDGTKVTISGLAEIRDTKSGDRQYGILDCDAGQFFAPGDVDDWKDASIYPITATKQGYELSIVTADGGEGVLSLGVRYSKLADLEEGQEYQITHYSIDTSTYEGRSWDAATLYASNGFRINGNKQVLSALESQLKAVNDGGTQHEIDAVLILDSVKASKDGKRYPNIRFKIETPEAKRLAAILAGATNSAA